MPSECSNAGGQPIQYWPCLKMSQEVYPWNVKFAQEPREPAFAPRQVLAGPEPLVREHAACALQRMVSAPFQAG